MSCTATSSPATSWIQRQKFEDDIMVMDFGIAKIIQDESAEHKSDQRLDSFEGDFRQSFRI